MLPTTKTLFRYCCFLTVLWRARDGSREMGRYWRLPVDSPPKKWIKSPPAVYARTRLFGMYGSFQTGMKNRPLLSKMPSVSDGQKLNSYPLSKSIII